MGAESGSQKILDAMDKGTRVDQIAKARENLRNEGIRACYFLQFGYPGETWHDIREHDQVSSATHGPTTSAFRFPILCPEPSSTIEFRRNSETKRTGPTVKTWP